MREISKASENSFRIRKIILEVITKPMRSIDIVQAMQSHLKREDRIARRDLNNHLTRLTSAGYLKVEKVSARPQDRNWYTVIKRDYNPVVMTGETKERYQQRKLHEQTQDSYEAKLIERKEVAAKIEISRGSAMRNVEGLAEKLKAQQRLINADRHRAISNGLGGCAGVSDIYGG